MIGALGAVSLGSRHMRGKIGVNVRFEIIEKTALLGTARIIRKVFSL